MALVVKPNSYQNKKIKGDPNYFTKEIQHYFYALTALPDPWNLFLWEDEIAREWCIAEFSERVSQPPANPGTAWQIRAGVWAPFLVEGKFDYSYAERLHYNNNLNRIVEELGTNSDTRQAWLPIFNPDDVQHMGGKKRIPCSLGYHFMIRNGELSMTYIQRSADYFQHFGNDIYLAWLMLDYVHQLLLHGFELKVERGYLFHHIFSLHSYAKDWPKLAEGISKLSKHS